jgi:uncharacterized protein
MITKDEILKRRDEIMAVARRYGASDIRLFGSIARGDANENSDIDFIVRFEPGRSLFDHGGLVMDLMDLLGVKVDVVSEGGIRGRWHDHLMREAMPL